MPIEIKKNGSNKPPQIEDTDLFDKIVKSLADSLLGEEEAKKSQIKKKKSKKK